MVARQRIVAIVQARMGSSRLSGKSMALMAGKPLLWHFLNRVRRAATPDALVLATTKLAEDDVLEDLARQEFGLSVFRGSADDLVDRFYQAATVNGAEVVVRLCADNPCVEPAEVDRIVEYHLASLNDFSSNTHNIMDNGYPDGLGAEVFSLQRLREIHESVKDPRNREHPHTNFYEHPELYKIGTVPCPQEFSRPELKLDVNTPEELAYIKGIFDNLYPVKADFTIMDVIRWLDAGELPDG